jgi:hypothetical protein
MRSLLAAAQHSAAQRSAAQPWRQAGGCLKDNKPAEHAGMRGMHGPKTELALPC